MRQLLLLIFIYPFLLFSQECTTITSVTNADSVVICVDSVSCNTVCDGSIEIDVYPQSSLYFYNWDSVAISGYNIRDSLCAGTYGVTITDVNGAFVTYQDIPVYEPSDINIFSIIINPSCYNYSDGDIDVVVNGGSPPYNYNWSNGFNSEDIDSILAGQYTLITTDQHNCKDTTTFILSNPLEITSVTIADTLSCIDSCDGEVSVIPSNGFSPYSFLWDDANAQTNDTAVSLCYGLYTVFITDANGCFDTNTVFVENPDTLKLGRIEIDSACFDICDGEILVNIEGGTFPYEVSWSVGGVVFDSTSLITDLCPEIFEITFMDANSCVASQQIILSERDSFRVLPSIINDSCFGSCTGQIMVQLLNPNSPPFIYNWSDGQQDSLAYNLCKDSINVEIVDAAGCIDTFFYFVDEPPLLTFDTAIIQHNDCYGQNQGSISINLSGGTGSISTHWTSNNFDTTTQNITNLYAGNYTIEIQDQNLCSRDTFYSVNQNDALQVYTSVNDVDCYGYSDGEINLTVIGGVSPYTIIWANIISDSSYVDSLSAGNYQYQIFDSLFCPLADSVTINQPDSITVSKNITDVLCHGYNTGSINLSVSGGMQPYSYLWSDSSTTQNLLSAGAGNYNVTVTDINNCEYDLSGIISEPQFPITLNLIGTNVLCNGDATGSIDLTINGGTPPYNYLWNNSATSDDINNLVSGLYYVDIVDDNGCDTSSLPITITEPSVISWTSNISNLLCYDDNSGSIDLTVNGGTPNYTYLWNNGEVTEDIFNLDEGNFTVTITDNNSCQILASFYVDEPTELNTSVNVSGVNCSGANSGSVDLSVTGGTPPYIYLWTPTGSTNQDINSLTANTYTCVVTDANNCTENIIADVEEPEFPISITGNVLDSDCNGEALGAIDITVSGGTPGYTYVWSPSGATSEDINNLFSGNFSVTVIDANSCSFTQNYFVDEPPVISSTAILNHILGCFGDATGSIDVQVTGGKPPYNYVWDNGSSTQDIESLIADDYTIIIRDFVNCEKMFTYTLTQPTQLILDYTITKATCEENNDGAIYTFVSGGTMPYNYEWSDGSDKKDLSGVSKGVYSLYLEDASGCALPVEIFEIGFDGFDGCIEIPTAFTPNGDGIHDEWAIYGLYNFPDVIVKVFNRWGQQVYESEGYDVPWDGKHNGKDLPIATYYYIIELIDSGKVFDGNVTIKR